MTQAALPLQAEPPIRRNSLKDWQKRKIQDWLVARVQELGHLEPNTELAAMLSETAAHPYEIKASNIKAAREVMGLVDVPEPPKAAKPGKAALAMALLQNAELSTRADQAELECRILSKEVLRLRAVIQLTQANLAKELEFGELLGAIDP